MAKLVRIVVTTSESGMAGPPEEVEVYRQVFKFEDLDIKKLIALVNNLTDDSSPS